MEKKPLPENSGTNSSKPSDEPLTTQPELLHLVGTGGICKECLGEDLDTCVCPVPKK